MTNDVIKELILGNVQGNLTPLVLGASTTETSFSVLGNAAVNPAIAQAPAILQMPDTQLAIPPGSGVAAPFVWDTGKPFMIQAAGIVTTGVTANLTIKLYQVPQAILKTLALGSLAGCNAILASTPKAVNSVAGANWFYQAILQWNSTGKVLNGAAWDIINGSIDAQGQSSIVTTLAQDADLNFILSATLSAGNAANVVTMEEFVAITV